MIGRIVITSVPRGLDGGDGVQTVLRTQGLSAPIADRLAQLASYPHPHDFGDPRNPRVLFHRIERAGGRTIHVLGSVRDAGASYSGRANHLAELIAIDEEEIRSLPGGPVYAALNYPWLDRWQGDPREVPLAEEPAVPARDPADPAETARSFRCEAWEAATGDAGWAGELAKSFFDGRRAVLDMNASVDAAALFAEAARLLPPSIRWQVEFNTCEIEPFPAYWRARRLNLTFVGPRPSAQDLVLVLDDIRNNRERASDQALARRARGEAPDKAAPSAVATTTSVAADADDAALRERLKAIREGRNRRSRPAVGDTMSGNDVSWWNWWTATAAGIGGLLVCAVIAAAVWIGRDPNQFQAFWNRHFGNGDPTPRATAEGSLRTSAEDERRVEEEERKKAAKDAADEAWQDAENRRLATEQADKKVADKREKEGQQKRANDEWKQAEKASQEAADARKKAIEGFINDFGDNAEDKTVPIQPAAQASERLLTVDDPLPAEKKLCAFDARNLDDPDCEIWSCASPNKVKFWAKPNGRDGAWVWNVMVQQHDPVLSEWIAPIEVCRLAVRDGQLWLEWPNKQITTTHAVFDSLQISLLKVSCRDKSDKQADGKGQKISRHIRFAERIPLEVGKPLGEIDPLVEKPIPLGPPELARRIRDIDTKGLRWSFRLTPPNRPHVVIEWPMKEATVKLPESPMPVSYKEVERDNKSKRPVRLVQRSGQMQLETTVALVIPEQAGEQAEFRIKTAINGLGNVPQLKNLFTLHFLKQQFDANKPSLLRDSLFRLLDGNVKDDYQAISFNAFLKEADVKHLILECGGIANYADFQEKYLHNHKMLSEVRRPGRYNVDLPDGGQQSVLRTEEEYQKDIQPLKERLMNLDQLRQEAVGFLSRRLQSEADAICIAIAGCSDDQSIDEVEDFCRDDFNRMTLEIVSISAEATARDSEGNPKKPEAGEKPLVIELMKSQSN
jgi:hypothetical protein